MGLTEILSIISDSVFDIAFIGTIVVAVLFIITIISKNKLLKKITVLIGSISIFLWTLQIILLVMIVINS